MRIAILCSLILATSPALAVELFRWIDKDGTVHYGDTAHPHAQFLDIKPSSGKGADKAALARAAECDKQKADLERYTNAARLQQKDALGKVRDFTPEERTQLLELTRKKVTEDCGPMSPPEAQK